MNVQLYPFSSPITFTGSVKGKDMQIYILGECHLPCRAYLIRFGDGFNDLFYKANENWHSKNNPDTDYILAVADTLSSLIKNKVFPE